VKKKLKQNREKFSESVININMGGRGGKEADAKHFKIRPLRYILCVLYH